MCWNTRQPEPTLYPEGIQGLARITAQWADTTLFWAAMGYNLSPKGAAHMFAGARPRCQGLWGRPRQDGRWHDAPAPGDATAAYKSYLRRLSNMLEGSAFLLGAAPTVADFAAYHPLCSHACGCRKWQAFWMPLRACWPGWTGWLRSVMAVCRSSARQKPCTGCPVNAARCCRRCVPGRTRHSLGQPRSPLLAESFGSEATEGELIAATRMHYTLRRTTNG